MYFSFVPSLSRTKWVLLLTSCLITTLLSAQDSRVEQIGERGFTFDAERLLWEESNLPQELMLSPDRTCIYLDETWHNWYYHDNKDGKRILELKPNAIFWRRVKNKNHVYAVFVDESSRRRLLGGAMPKPATPASSGESRAIGQRKFTFKGQTWVDDSLTEEYRLLFQFSCVHGDETWRKWYATKELKPILNLGANVFFPHKDAQGQEHVYAVFKNKKLRLNAHELTAETDHPGRLTVDKIKERTTTPVPIPVGGSAATAAGSGGIMGISGTTMAIIGGGALVGAVIIQSNGDDKSGSP